MARTKGAKDRGLRKKPAAKRPAIKQDPPSQTLRPEAQSDPATIDRPPIPVNDFKAAIAAELHQADVSSPGQAETQPSEAANPGQASSFDPSSLTIEGLEAAFQLPFFVLARVLAWLKIAPDPLPIRELGKRKARVLAKPSYAVYEHYARQYLGFHPENGVHVAIGVTGLNTVGISPDLVEAIEESRRRAAAKAPTPPSQSGPPMT
jgi:hypothetical protein